MFLYKLGDHCHEQKQLGAHPRAEVRMAVMEEERQRGHSCRATQDQVATATGRGAHSDWGDAGEV